MISALRSILKWTIIVILYFCVTFLGRTLVDKVFPPQRRSSVTTSTRTLVWLHCGQATAPWSRASARHAVTDESAASPRKVSARPSVKVESYSSTSEICLPSTKRITLALGMIRTAGTWRCVMIRKQSAHSGSACS